MTEKAVIRFINIPKSQNVELEVPLNITANDLIIALNRSFELGMDTENIFNCYLVSEDPIACLKGNKLLSEFGIRNGTYVIHAREQK